MPLKIAAKVDRADRHYFKREIEPSLKGVPEIGWVLARWSQRPGWQVVTQNVDDLHERAGRVRA